MIGIVVEVSAFSFNVVGERIHKGFRALGYKLPLINPFLSFMVGRFRRLIYIGETVFHAKFGFHKRYMDYAEKLVLWTDTIINLHELPDEDVDLINNGNFINIAVSNYSANCMRIRGLRVDGVVGRPLDSEAIEVALKTDSPYREKFGKYILTIAREGAPESKHPRKGLDRFDEALGMIRGELKARGIKTVAVTNIPLKNIDYIIPSGSLRGSEVFSLIRGATLFVFPSRGEGFGLPPLEAMSVGTPIVYTNIPSHNEFTVGIPVEAEYQEISEHVPSLNVRWTVWDYPAEKLAEAILYALDMMGTEYMEKLCRKAMEESRKFYETEIAKKLLDAI